jgi:hypothetical protein
MFEVFSYKRLIKKTESPPRLRYFKGFFCKRGETPFSNKGLTQHGALLILLSSGQQTGIALHLANIKWITGLTAPWLAC